MNKTIPITNPGDSPVFVGGKMIPPGETRVFTEAELPPEYKAPAPVAAAQAAGPDEALLLILAATVAQVVAGLPDLSDEELARLALLEAEGKDRKGVLEAITALQLERAENAVLEGSGDGDGDGDPGPGDAGDGGA